MFPYCREVGFRVGQIEKTGEVADALRTKMLELQDGETIRAGCSGVRAEANSFTYLCGSER